ncbi:MAG: hypothetical protein JWN00_5839 [Actinomycetia bacterium]|nr:hypothetical protein [Actinomycetes bacterium]
MNWETVNAFSRSVLPVTFGNSDGPGFETSRNGQLCVRLLPSMGENLGFLELMAA